MASSGFSAYKIMSSAEVILLLLFQCGCLEFLFLAYLLWWGLPIPGWIEVARGVMLRLLLILEEELSAFHHWLRCQPCSRHVWPLSCWRALLLNRVGCIFIQTDVEFGPVLFLRLLRWSYDVGPLFYSGGVVIRWWWWFPHTEPSWPLRDEFHWIMVCDSFNVLLFSVC